jgi:O-antigen/teichoic acid export membrane protein
MRKKGLLKPLRKKINGNPFIKNLGWLGVAQGGIRVTRLSATVILPRFLTPDDYGLAALVLTTYEFTQTLTKIGINAKVIQASDEEIEEVCNSAYWLNWLIFCGLFVAQCLVAFPVAWFFNHDELILPICIIGGTFLISPIGRIQAGLLQRESCFKTIAAAQVLRYGTANILTATFAVMGMGLWAIVLPIVLASPLEFIVYLVKHPWRVQYFTAKQWNNIFRFGVNILGSSMLKTFRQNMDYLLVGRILGVTELGKYYFAFNAGLGISITIINSITTALYPLLCKFKGNFNRLKQEYRKNLKIIAIVIIPFVLLQVSLAPFYVPIIFGEKWIPAIPILILICLSAIPRPFNNAAFALLAAVDKPQIFLVWNFIFTIIFAISLLIGVQWNILGVASAVLASHAIFIPIFVHWSTRYVFSGR